MICVNIKEVNGMGVPVRSNFLLYIFILVCYNTQQSEEGNEYSCCNRTTGRDVIDCEHLMEAVNRRTFRS